MPTALPRQRRGQPEKAVQSNACNLLRSIGAKVYVIGTHRRRGDYQGTMQTPGIPDLAAYLPPQPNRVWADSTVVPPHVLLWMECKAPGGRASDPQKEFRQLSQAAGIRHVVGGLDELIAELVDGGWLKAENLPHYKQPSPARAGARS